MKKQLAFEPEPTPEQVRFLKERLCEFNATATGPASRVPALGTRLNFSPNSFLSMFTLDERQWVQARV